MDIFNFLWYNIIKKQEKLLWTPRYLKGIPIHLAQASVYIIVAKERQRRTTFTGLKYGCIIA
jgi:hypothetical protein